MVYYAELNIISMILCFIIQQKEAKDKQEIFISKSFRHILLIIEMILLLDTVSLFIQNDIIAHNYWFHLMVMNGYFVLQALFPMELLLYCIDTDRIKSKLVNFLISLPLAATVICIIINTFRPFAFHIVENDRYERMTAQGFAYVNLWPLIYIFAGIVTIARSYIKSSGKNRETYRHIIVFGSFALAGGILAFLFKGFLLWPYIALDLIYLYLNVLSKNHHKLDVLAFKDSLTGIGNVASYESVIEHVYEQIDSGTAEFALVIMDANGLKYINDSFGHEAGNKYIKACAMYICRIFDHSPVFRIGGDEFIAILENDDYRNRESLIEQFDSEMDGESVVSGGEVLRISIARGLAEFSKGMSYSEVFYRADSKMYLNKAEMKKRHSIPSR